MSQTIYRAKGSTHKKLGMWTGAAVVVLLLALVVAETWFHLHRDVHLRPFAGIGGPFSLIDHRGKPVTEQDYLGKPTLIFFGFTFCPDICPTTLLELTDRLRELGADADRLNVLFITVDPERDTPEQLALYLSSFDSRITGLTGTQTNISAVVAEYRIFARKVPLKDGGYTMDHTAAIHMMNKHGQFVGLINPRESEAMARAKLRRLLNDTASG